ncbi:hypothetical protein DVH05_014889 [Phytophthora capsici]|nr:hypothetical protein DVH05_014889 [Phytophthora capsici]
MRGTTTKLASRCGGTLARCDRAFTGTDSHDQRRYKWANNTLRLKDVADVMENEQTLRERSRRVKEITQAKASSYSYIIPDGLIISLQAAMDYFRSRQFEDREAKKAVVDLTCSPNSAEEEKLAFWVTPELEPFSAYGQYLIVALL